MALPKVLVGAPTYVGKEYCLVEFATALKSMCYPNMDFCFVDNSDTEEFSIKMNNAGLNTVWKPSAIKLATKKLERGSNYLRNKTLTEGYDYHLQLETDMIVKPWTLVEMLAQEKKVLGSLYSIYMGAHRKKMVFTMDYDKYLNQITSTHTLNDWAKIPQPVMKVQSCGLGCTLIHRSVYETDKIEYRSSIQTTPDSFFYRDLATKGVNVFVHTAEFLTHMNKGDWSMDQKGFGK